MRNESYGKLDLIAESVIWYPMEPDGTRFWLLYFIRSRKWHSTCAFADGGNTAREGYDEGSIFM